jgi:plastocyanin
MKGTVLVGVLVCLGVVAAATALTNVQIRDNEFVPPTVVILKGETVRWTNVGVLVHTSTSDTGKWDSGDLSHGQHFDFKFTTTGKFPYHCTYHPEMHGTVRVTETAVAPTSFGRVKTLFR